MRTSYLIDDLRVGGAQMHLARLAAELAQRGHDCEVVSLGPVSTAVAGHLPSSVPLVRFRLESVRAVSFPLHFLRLVRHLRRRRPQIVHTYLNTAGVFGLLAARLARVPFVITSRRDIGVFRSGRVRRLEAWLSGRWADRVFCVCEAVAAAVRRDEGIPDAMIRVLYNGVAVPADAAAGGRQRGEPPRFGIVSALNRREKGHREFLEAASRVAKEEPGIEFLVAGDGPLRGSLEKMARDLGLGSSVRFLGETADVGALLSSLDVLVVPSWTEGMSNAALEAMARALPVVASAVDGNLELVRGGETGLLVPARDPQALAEAMLTYARDPDLRRAHGRAARARIKDRFDIARMVARHEQEYAALSAGAGPARRARVALVESSSGVGGTAKCVYQLVETLDPAKYELYVVARERVGWPARVEAGGRAAEVAFTRFDTRRPPPSASRLVNYARKAGEVARIVSRSRYFVRFLRSRRIDLVHTNNNILDQLPAILAARRLRIPVICQIHDEVPLTLIERLGARLVDRFWMLSRSSRDLYRHDVPASRIEIVPDGLLLRDYEGVLPEPDPPVRRPAVGTVGRLVPWKGQETLVRAAPLVRDAVPEACFYLIGDDPSGDTSFADRLRRLAEQLGCADALVFTGWMEDPRPVLARLDAAVCPSLRPEPFGLVILEAMALGVPVLATRQGGPLDIIEDGRDGLLFAPGDERELARLLVAVLGDRELAGRMASAARAKVEERYAMTAVVRRVEDGYERLLGGRE